MAFQRLWVHGFIADNMFVEMSHCSPISYLMTAEVNIFIYSTKFDWKRIDDSVEVLYN